MNSTFQTKSCFVYAHRCAAILCFIVTTTGCLAYNTCAEEKGAVIGNVALELDLRESNVRKQEMPVGNMVTDAFLEEARDAIGCTALPTDVGETLDLNETGTSGSPCPVIAIQNAGGIRQETGCGLRDTIPAGNIYAKDIEDMLPFANELWTVRLKGKDIQLLLEHAVDALGILGIGSEAGHFLHVAGVSYHVDCTKEPQVLSADQKQIVTQGSRVSNVLVGQGAAVTPLEEETEYEVITNAYIAGGNDGFLGFLQRDADDNVLMDAEGNALSKATREQDLIQGNGAPLLDSEAVKDWIRAHYDQNQSVGRSPEGRITLEDSCFN